MFNIFRYVFYLLATYITTDYDCTDIIFDQVFFRSGAAWSCDTTFSRSIKHRTRSDITNTLRSFGSRGISQIIKYTWAPYYHPAAFYGDLGAIPYPNRFTLAFILPDPVSDPWMFLILEYIFPVLALQGLPPSASAFIHSLFIIHFVHIPVPAQGARGEFPSPLG